MARAFRFSRAGDISLLKSVFRLDRTAEEAAPVVPRFNADNLNTGTVDDNDFTSAPTVNKTLEFSGGENGIGATVVTPNHIISETQSAFTIRIIDKEDFTATESISRSMDLQGSSAYDDGAIYTYSGTNDDIIRRLEYDSDADSFQEIWSTDVEETVAFSSPAIGEDTIGVAALTDGLVVIDKEDGSVLGSTGGDVNAAAPAYEDGEYIALAADAPAIVTVDETGSITGSDGGTITGYASQLRCDAIATGENNYFLGDTLDDKLFGIDKVDYSKSWEVSFDNAVRSASIIVGDYVIGHTLTEMKSITRDAGVTNWTISQADLEAETEAGDQFSRTSPFSTGGVIYQGTQNGYIIAIDPDTGDFVWSKDLVGVGVGNIVTSGESMYTGVGDNGDPNNKILELKP